MGEKVDKAYLEKQFKALADTMKKNKDMYGMLEKNKVDVVQQLKENIKALETKLKEKDEKIIKLEERVDQLENRSRICNIEIKGTCLNQRMRTWQT